MSQRPETQSASKADPDPRFATDVEAEEFLFVNRDQNTIQHGTRSQVVSSHVQLSQRKRMLEEQDIEKTKDPGASSPKTVEAPRRGGVIQPWRVDPAAHQSKTMQTTRRAMASSERIVPNPIGAIQSGNSDPFSSLPVTVDPVTNRILSWYRDDGAPSMFPLEKKVYGSFNPSARRAWERTIKAVQSPELAQPHIAAVCALMAQRTQSDVIQGLCLQLKGKAYSVLRRTLAETEGRRDLDTIRMILDMFWAEHNSGNEAATKTHLNLLVDWAQKEDLSESDSDLRAELLTADIVFAGTNLETPLLDVAAWSMEDAFDEWRLELEDQDRRMIAATSTGIDEALAEGRLRSLFSRLRELAEVAELAVSKRISSYSVFHWLTFRLLSCESALLSQVVEYRGSGFNTEERGTAADQTSYEIYCACLSTLAWFWATLVSPLRQRKPLLASRLQQSQQRCGLEVNVHPRLRNLALWSFYAGSLLEEKLNTETDGRAMNNWQATQFQHLANTVGGGDLALISRILNGFVHSDSLRNLNIS